MTWLTIENKQFQNGRFYFCIISRLLLYKNNAKWPDHIKLIKQNVSWHKDSPWLVSQKRFENGWLATIFTPFVHYPEKHHSKRINLSGRFSENIITQDNFHRCKFINSWPVPFLKFRSCLRTLLLDMYIISMVLCCIICVTQCQPSFE